MVLGVGRADQRVGRGRPRDRCVLGSRLWRAAVRCYAQEWQGAEWEWQVGQTQALAATICDSAPGPDGLPYAWWASAPPEAHNLLDDIACSMQEGGDMAQVLSRSVAVTILKAEVLEDKEFVRCSADSVRPLH